MTEIEQKVIEAASAITDAKVTIDTQLIDIMDSLERSQLIVDLTDMFPDKNLIAEEKFFEAASIKDLANIIENTK